MSPDSMLDAIEAAIPESFTARRAFRSALELARAQLPSELQVVGNPGTIPDGGVRPDDLLVRVNPGEPVAPLVGQITSEATWSPGGDAWDAEYSGQGYYARVAPMYGPNVIPVPRWRRILDSRRRLPANHILLRPRVLPRVVRRRPVYRAAPLPVWPAAPPLPVVEPVPTYVEPEPAEPFVGMEPPPELPEPGLDEPIDWEQTYATEGIAPGSMDPEAGPAAIALAAPAVISAAELGLAVFTAGQPLVLSGRLSSEATTVNYIHANTPPELSFRKAVDEFEITAHHPRLGIDTQRFWFRLSFEYNDHDLRNVAVVLLEDKSSRLPSSQFAIRFVGQPHSVPADPVAQIMFQISGRWDPIGRGVESFWGELLVSADGTVKVTVSSEQGWVRQGSYRRVSAVGPPAPAQVTAFWDVFFSPPGSDRVEAGSESELVQWYRRLPPKVRERIEEGSLPIHLDGYASTTQPGPANRELSRRRALTVQRILQDIAGSSAKFELVAHGEYQAKTPDQVEDRNERRVRVSVPYLVPGGAPTPPDGAGFLDALRRILGSVVNVTKFVALVRGGKEDEAVRLALQQGIRDINGLTDLVFYARHGRVHKLVPGEPGFQRLAADWRQIRDRFVRPTLARS